MQDKYKDADEAKVVLRYRIWPAVIGALSAAGVAGGMTEFFSHKVPTVTDLIDDVDKAAGELLKRAMASDKNEDGRAYQLSSSRATPMTIKPPTNDPMNEPTMISISATLFQVLSGFAYHPVAQEVKS